MQMKKCNYTHRDNGGKWGGYVYNPTSVNHRLL